MPPKETEELTAVPREATPEDVQTPQRMQGFERANLYAYENGRPITWEDIRIRRPRDAESS